MRSKSIEYHRITRKSTQLFYIFASFLGDSLKKHHYCKSVEYLSAAWPSGLEGRFYDGHVRKIDGSTPTQASLLRPWTRCFTTIISARWNLTSSKLRKSKAKFKEFRSKNKQQIEKVRSKIQKHRQLLSESGFVSRIAPPSLSRDRRIKMKKKSCQRKSNVWKKHICKITSQICKNEF